MYSPYGGDPSFRIKGGAQAVGLARGMPPEQPQLEMCQLPRK